MDSRNAEAMRMTLAAYRAGDASKTLFQSRVAARFQRAEISKKPTHRHVGNVPPQASGTGSESAGTDEGLDQDATALTGVDLGIFTWRL